MQEVFEKIRKKINDNAYIVTQSNNSKEFGMTVLGIEQVLDEVAEEYNNKWIPVSDRLPSLEERKKTYCSYADEAEFIVMIEGATIPTTLYIKMEENIWFDDDYNYYKVIAWQPLPEPYVEGGDKAEGDIKVVGTHSKSNVIKV